MGSALYVFGDLGAGGLLLVAAAARNASHGRQRTGYDGPPLGR